MVHPLTLQLFAKGAGMINPAMATMLCFIITDANIPKTDMDTLLTASTEHSFNRISVDGDTSTNDTVMLAVKQTKCEATIKRLLQQASKQNNV